MGNIIAYVEDGNIVSFCWFAKYVVALIKCAFSDGSDCAIGKVHGSCTPRQQQQG